MPLVRPTIIDEFYFFAPIQKFDPDNRSVAIFLPINGFKTKHVDLDALKTTSNLVAKSSHIIIALAVGANEVISSA